jgi:hypothetical protein
MNESLLEIRQEIATQLAPPRTLLGDQRFARRKIITRPALAVEIDSGAALGVYFCTP